MTTSNHRRIHRRADAQSVPDLTANLDNSEQMEKRRTSAYSKMDNSLRELNLSGIHEFSKSNTRYGKVFWSVMITVAIIGSCYEVYKIIYHFYTCPIVTEWSVKASRSVEFPKIEICLPASIGQRQLEASPIALDVALAMREKLLYTTMTVGSKVNKSRTKRSLVDSDWTFLDDVWELINDKSRFKRDHSDKAETKLTPEEVYSNFMNLSFGVADIFLDCVFRQKMLRQLNCEDIVTEVLNPNWGKCFVVDLGEMEQHVPGQGLVLVLNAQIDNYPTMAGLVPKVQGVILSVHHEYTPYSFKYINVPTKMYTRIGLQAEHHEYLDVESGPKAQPCVGEEEANFTILAMNYTVAACQMDCFQQLTLDKCQCILMQDVKFVKEEILNSTRFCSKEDAVNCVLPVCTESLDSQAIYDQCCNRCDTPCSTWDYNAQASAMNLHPASFEFLKKRNLSLDNLIYIHVAHNSLEYTNVDQEWATEIDNLIADFGGQVGLWIGGNLITFIQIPIILVMLSFFSVYERVKGIGKVRRAVTKKKNMWSTIIDAERGSRREPVIDNKIVEEKQMENA